MPVILFSFVPADGKKLSMGTIGNEYM